ncbi:MAG: hypothetical protein ACRDNZ_18545 [Streptosporangiaceae bacterium]
MPQRHHDALEEACRRLIAAGGLPDRAGQPTQIQLHLTLEELLRLQPRLPSRPRRPRRTGPAGSRVGAVACGRAGRGV